MFDSVIKRLIGDMDEKKVYRKFRKRVNALPKDYRFAFRKIQHYMFCFGFSDGDIFTDLVDLFEVSAAEGRQVLDVIGSDAGKFCDELIRASAVNTETLQKKLNNEIMEKLNKKER